MGNTQCTLICCSVRDEVQTISIKKSPFYPSKFRWRPDELAHVTNMERRFNDEDRDLN